MTEAKRAYDEMPGKLGVLALRVRAILKGVEAGERFDVTGIDDDVKALRDMADLLAVAAVRLVSTLPR